MIERNRPHECGLLMSAKAVFLADSSFPNAVKRIKIPIFGHILNSGGKYVYIPEMF